MRAWTNKGILLDTGQDVERGGRQWKALLVLILSQNDAIPRGNRPSGRRYAIVLPTRAVYRDIVSRLMLVKPTSYAVHARVRRSHES
jgi:hypothetical protein